MRLFLIAADRSHKFAAAVCCSKAHQMPRRYLCVLPTRSRPGLFSGD
jgi:hypothetical protein